jgi:hypothetical protein
MTWWVACFVLFCFVLFVTPRDLSNHGTSCCALLVSSESSQWLVGVHWLGLRLFGATVQKLLIIEPFFQSKSNQNQNQNYKLYWNLRVFFISLESSERESDLLKFISQFLEPRCERYWFLSGFCCWKFKQITKIGFEPLNFGQKNQLSPQHVHTWANGTQTTLVSTKRPPSKEIKVPSVVGGCWFTLAHLNPGFSQIFMKFCRLESGPKVQTIFATYNKRRQKKKHKVTLWDLASSSLLPFVLFWNLFCLDVPTSRRFKFVVCSNFQPFARGVVCVSASLGEMEVVGSLYDAVLFLGCHPFSK